MGRSLGLTAATDNRKHWPGTTAEPAGRRGSVRRRREDAPVGGTSDATRVCGLTGFCVYCAFAGWMLMSVDDTQADRPAQVRVAMCQTLCVDGDREGNFRRIEEALARAKAETAQIACFPETAILGWVNPEAHNKACPIPGDDVRRLGQLAKRYGMMLCAGLAEKDGDRLYDSVVLIERDGRLLLKHRKIGILTALMTPPYTPGDSIDAVETRFGRIGMLVCADTFNAKNLEAMRDEKPDLVIVPYGWAAKPDAWPQHGESLRKVVSNAARTIGAPVVGTDLVGTITHGPWTGRTYGGQSIAIDPDGRVLATGKDRKPDVIVLEVQPEWRDPRKVGSEEGR